MNQLYYTPPDNEYFEDMRLNAIRIWETYDNTYGYSQDKIDRIKTIGNIDDNFMYMVAMFDRNNQKRLAKMINRDTLKAVNERLLAGGSPEYLLL